MPVIQWIKENFNGFTTSMCNMVLRSIEFVPDRLKTEEMCNKAVCMDLYILELVSDHLKTHGNV